MPKAWKKLDLIKNPDDLKKHLGKMAYLLFYSDTMIGSTKITDINAYLIEEGILETFTDDPADVTLLYGLVLNPEELPMELPDDMPENYGLFAIKYDNYSTMEHEEVNDFEAAAEYIEWGIETGDGLLDIEDFAVIFGINLAFTLQVMSASGAMSHDNKIALGAL